MTFREQLGNYIETLGCTGKELSDASGLSAAVISRYRAGERSPALGSESLAKLAAGLSALAARSQLKNMDEKTVAASLAAALSSGGIAANDTLGNNLNALISLLDISPSELARAMSYDASYISKIRTGQRRPSDCAAFAEGIADFVTRRYRRENDLLLISELVGCTEASLLDIGIGTAAIKTWLCSGSAPKSEEVSHFLEKLDEFDLNEYIRSIHFDELKVPSMPFTLPTSKNYYGVSEMRAGELDFFKATVLSRSTEPVFMCSDMPMTDMAEDKDFPKKWMFGLAVMLKKGLHLNVVHNIDRPFAEMMLGLEGWIPLYMTGQVSPYYMKSAQNAVYNHFDYVSGAAALSGEGVAGAHEDGKYFLTNNKRALEYYKKRAAALLQKAQPLMDIFRSEAKGLYSAFVRGEAENEGDRRSILSSPPIYTLPEYLLMRILIRSGISGSEAQQLLSYATEERQRIETILGHSPVTDELHQLSKEEFEKYPAVLSLTGAFYENDIAYTYDEYLEHLQHTEEFAKTHMGYSFYANKSRAFRNIQITIREGKWVMLSKSKSPTIHFVIRQPKLRSALEKLVIPVVE